MSRNKNRAAGQTAVTISIPSELLEKVDALAIKDSRKRSPYIVRLLEKYADDLLVSMPAGLLARIDALAAADQRSRESWIIKALENALAEAADGKRLPDIPKPKPAAPALDSPRNDATVGGRSSGQTKKRSLKYDEEERPAPRVTTSSPDDLHGAL